MTAPRDITAADPQTAFLDEVAAHLRDVAASVDIKMMITACPDRTRPADSAALMARLRAAAGPDLRFTLARPELPATLVVISRPLAKPKDLTWVATTFGNLKTTREYRLALTSTSGLLTDLLRQAPYLNPIDTLADTLSAQTGSRCLVETALRIAETDLQAYVFKVIR